MTAPRLATVDELIRQALEAGDPAGERRWTAVRALQRRGDAETFEAARRLCGAGRPAERALGADVLGQLGAPELPFGDQTVAPLTALCGPHEHPDVVHAALCALGHLDDPRALDTFLGCKDHSDPEVRFAVAANLPSAMGRDEDPRGVAALIQLSDDPDEEVRDWATMSLGVRLDADTAEVRDALARRLDDRAGDVAGEAMVGLARRGDRRAFEPIMAALACGEPEAGELVVEAAAELADPRLHPALLALRERGWARDDPRPWWLEQALKRCAPPRSRG
jgi:HEAT repeat protein